MTLYPNNSTKQVVDNELNKKLKKFDERIENNSSEITSLKSRVSNTEDNITSINGDIEGLEEDIGSLDTRVDTVELALDEKQDTLNFDNAPTSNSDNPVKSGGIYDALETKLDKESVKFDPEPNGTDALSTGGAYDIVQDISERIDNIQNQGALLSNDNVDISNNGCLKIDNQQEVETDAIEVLNGDTKLKDTEINGDLSVSGNIDGNVATHSANGLMSSEDKVRLDAIDSSLEDKTVSDTLTDSSTVIPSGKAVSDIIGSLDASSVGGSGKYISEISETDGVITATSEDIDTAVTSGSSKPVTSGGVANVLSNLPTDAVLHYSFDEVPDLPDGTASYKKDNDFTDTTGWAGSATATVSNGKITFSGNANTYMKYNISLSQEQIILIKGIAKVDITTILLSVRNNGASSDTPIASTSVTAGQSFEMVGVVNASSNGFIFYSSNQWEIEISQIYIGDGSYSTPIIDNANGKWNSVSQSGVAVKGVSGKGLYCPSNQVVDINGFNLTNDFTFSVWVNSHSNANNQGGRIFSTDSQFSCYNGYPTGNNYLYFALESDTSGSVFVTTSSLLPINQFNHLVFTKSGTTVKVYLNGSLLKQQTISFSNLKQSTAGHIGNIYNSRPQSYDDLLIFDRALSETEIKALYYNKANTPKYYNLNNFKLDLIPLPPSTDGTYQLTATVSNGSVSYLWV